MDSRGEMRGGNRIYKTEKILRIAIDDKNIGTQEVGHMRYHEDRDGC